MRVWRQARAKTAVVATIAFAAGALAAAPTAAGDGTPGPLAAVDFVAAWTNDDGTVDGADIGDTGLASIGYDIWPAGVSSDDPEAAGLPAPRRPDDAAKCTTEVRSGDPDLVDLTIENGYPQYVCTFTVVVENGSSLPATIAPAVIDADGGLAVAEITDPPMPDVLGPGAIATAVFAVRILNEARQDSVLGFTIAILVSNPPCDEAVVFGVERGSGDLYEIDLDAGIAYLLADIVDPEPANVNSPNGLAYDGGSGRLYFSASLEGAATSDLYFWDGAAVSFAGTVTGQVAGATFHAGEFYYVLNATDDLVKVAFGPGGTVSTVAPVHLDFAGTATFRFGDIAITADGTMLYGASLQSGATPPTFFSIDLATGAYTAVSTTDGIKLQLAFGDNGILYGHSTGTGEFFVVDPATGATTPAGTPTGANDWFTDLASASCVPGFEPEP